MDYADIPVILVMFLVGCLTVAATLFLRRATISMQSSPTNSMTDHSTAEKETSGAKEEILEKTEGDMCFCGAGVASLCCRDYKQLLSKNKRKDPDDKDEPGPTCKHTRVSRHGSNGVVNILKCKDCKQLLSKTRKPEAAD